LRDRTITVMRMILATLLLMGGFQTTTYPALSQQAPATQPNVQDTPVSPMSQPSVDKSQPAAAKNMPVEDSHKVQSDRTTTILRVGKDLLQIVFSWPVIVLVIVLFLAFSRTASGRLAALFQPFRSIKVLGAELVFTREAKSTADEVLESYRKQVKSEFDRRVEILRLWDKLQNVVELHIMKKAKVQGKDFRCTIHVPDVLFQDTLYQLLDYYPTGGGRGRRRSLRFGIIGLAWRSTVDQVAGEVTTDPQQLLKDWGMKKHEATAAGHERQSFACVVLTDVSKTPVGLFYLDAMGKNAFGTDNKEAPNLIDVIRKGVEETGLIRDLADLGKELRQWSPVIRLYEES
jgi:hypothetical protein